MAKDPMHQTPDVPGTSPVTDNPNPGGSQGMDTTGPSTDSVRGDMRPETESVADSIAGNNPSQRKPAPEGASDARTFRCSDLGNSDCRFEVVGRSHEDLMPRIERHAREAHDEGWWDRMKSKIMDNLRDRRAA